jgi:hypothetical protein
MVLEETLGSIIFAQPSTALPWFLMHVNRYGDMHGIIDTYYNHVLIDSQ